MEPHMQRPIDRDDLNHLATLFQSTRIRLNLTIIDVVREAGYKNTNKGCRHLRHLERSRELPSDEIYQRFAQVLDIDFTELEADIAARREARRTIPPQDLPPRILGALLERARQAAGLTHKELTEALGWLPRDIRERRLRRLEAGRDRFPSNTELQELASALSLSIDTLKAARHQEYAHYDNLKKAPKFIFRAMPAIYITQSLPDDLNPATASAATAGAIAYAEEFATLRGFNTCLVFPDSRSLYLFPSGSRSESFEPPQMRLG